MDLSSPISSVIPSGHGVVLAVLARTAEPLSGRRVAELTGGRLSQTGTNNVLGELAESGVVTVEIRPPAKLYRLNREHLAADAIVALAELRARLIDSTRELLHEWDPAPAGAWMFGSAARGDGNVHSDIDVLLVRGVDTPEGDDRWAHQVDGLTERVGAWSGNLCSVVEYSRSEFDALFAGSERLGGELRRDGIRLAGDLTVPATPKAARR